MQSRKRPVIEDSIFVTCLNIRISCFKTWLRLTELYAYSQHDGKSFLISDLLSFESLDQFYSQFMCLLVFNY